MSLFLLPTNMDATGFIAAVHKAVGFDDANDTTMLSAELFQSEILGSLMLPPVKLP